MDVENSVPTLYFQEKLIDPYQIYLFYTITELYYQIELQISQNLKITNKKMNKKSYFMLVSKFLLIVTLLVTNLDSIKME